MEKVRFGVVGTNFITDWVIAGGRQDARFELTAVCSRTAERAAEFARKHDIPYQFTSLEEMARSPYVDAVYIASPNFMHARQSILCMSYGKHVLCEKPLASNVAEAEAMVEASEKYHVCLMEAMKPTLTPNFRMVMDRLWRLGKLRRYFASYCQYSSRYDAYKAGKQVNAFNPAYSNGALMDIGVYTVYPMVVLFGLPREIIASGTLLASGTDGQGSVLFRYEGMEAGVVYSKIADSYLPTEIQGEEGTLTLDHIHKIGRVCYMPRPASKGDGVSVEDWTCPAEMNEYYYEVAEFIGLVLAGKRQSCINSHVHSLNTLKVLDEVRRQLGIVFPADNR